MSNSASNIITHTAHLWRTDARVRVIIGAALLVALMLPIDLAMQLVYGISSLKPLQLWLTESAWATDDSWRPMRAAYDWVISAPDGTLYQEIFFERRLKFQYAPTSLLPYAAIEGLGMTADPVLLNRINRVLLLASAVGVGAITWILMRRAQTTANADPAPPLLGALLTAGAVFLFFPMTYGYQLGQLQVWNNALFVFACLAWVVDRRILAGVLLGLVCLLKPQLGLFAIWALIRKDWRFLIGLAATGAIGLGLSVLLFGIQNHIAYLDVLSYMSRHGEGHLSNHSFNGLLHRITGNDDGMVWSNEAFSPFNPIVYAGTLITSLAIVLIGLWPRGPVTGLGGLLQFQLAALAFTIASPIAWEPHYGVLAPIFAALLCAMMAMPEGKPRRRWLITLGAAFVFAAMHLPVVREFAHTPLLLLQSYLLFAALGVLFMLWRFSGRSAPAA